MTEMPREPTEQRDTTLRDLEREATKFIQLMNAIINGPNTMNMIAISDFEEFVKRQVINLLACLISNAEVRNRIEEDIRELREDEVSTRKAVKIFTGESELVEVVGFAVTVVHIGGPQNNNKKVVVIGVPDQNQNYHPLLLFAVTKDSEGGHVFRLLKKSQEIMTESFLIGPWELVKSADSNEREYGPVSQTSRSKRIAILEKIATYLEFRITTGEEGNIRGEIRRNIWDFQLRSSSNSNPQPRSREER